MMTENETLKSKLAAVTERAEKAEAGLSLAICALEQIRVVGHNSRCIRFDAPYNLDSTECIIATEALTQSSIRAEVERIKALEKSAAEAEELTSILNRKEAEIKALTKIQRRQAYALKPYQWRPISEIHEDLGSCVLIDIEDPGYQEIGSNLDSGFDPTRWTHFAEVPKLTGKQALELITAMKAAGEEL